MTAHFSPSRPSTRLLGETESVCPVCLARIKARRVAEGDRVVLRKTCPDHGAFSAVVWRGAPDYEAWGRTVAPSAPPAQCATESRLGCPFDCGLCPEHRQQSCCVLLEVTRRCNLACPVCFAEAGGGDADPGLEEIGTWLDALRAGGRVVNIQLSGGEPTMRDDLPAIVALCRAKGFPFVQVNTNGIRIARDPVYLKRLRAAGLDCVFLQFDGVEDGVHTWIRGRALRAEKERAIENCAGVGVGVVLVPVLVPGVNTGQVGDIVRFAIARMPTVRTVHFQPITYFGRYPTPPLDSARITIPEVLRLIEAQTAGAFRAADFRPGTAENPYCSFNGRFLVAPDGGVQALRVPDGSGCCSAAAAPERGGNKADAAGRARSFVARHWAAAPLSSPGGANGGAPDGLDAVLEAQRRTLCLSGMAFQDAWTLDLDRLRQCYIHVLAPDRRLVPLCAFNLSSLGGTALYRGVGS